MAKYKVLVIAMSIKGGKIAKSKDILDESHLIDKQAAVEGGYVEEVKEGKSKKKKESDVKKEDSPKKSK